MIEDYLRVKELPNGSRFMEPEFRIRDRLEGRRINEIFTAEKVAEAYEMLEQRKNYFPDELEAVIGRMRMLVEQYSGSNDDSKIWKYIRECAFFIRNQAPIFGYSIIGKFGDLAFRHLESKGQDFSIGLIAHLTAQIEQAAGNGGNKFTAKQVAELKKLSELIRKETEELVY